MKIMCDGCGTFHPFLFDEPVSTAHVKVMLDEYEWERRDKTDLCPDCKAIGRP